MRVGGSTKARLRIPSAISAVVVTTRPKTRHRGCSASNAYHSLLDAQAGRTLSWFRNSTATTPTATARSSLSRKAASEALTGAHAGGVLSRDMLINQSADVVHDGGRQHRWVREREHSSGSARSETPACMETPSARTGRLRQRPTRRCERDGWRR